MDLTPFPEMTTEQQQAIQQYTRSQVMEHLTDAQRVQPDANASQAQADEEERGAHHEEQDSRGSDNIPTCRLVEGLTRMFEAMQEKAEKQQQFAAATTTQTRSVVFSQTSMRMPAAFDGSFKVGEDPQQRVLIFSSQMNAFFGQQRSLQAVESLTPIKVGQPNVDEVALEAERGAELIDQAYRA